MSLAEKHACRSLLICSTEDDNPTDNHAGTRLADRIAYKRRKMISSGGKYRDCSFILGSVATIERLWSIAGNVLMNHRKEMTPIVFEALLFLRTNKQYWNEHTVKEAWRMNKSEAVRRRLEEDDAIEEQQ